MDEAVWRIELLGGLRVAAVNNEAQDTITRFRTQKTAALLAYLALHRERPLGREVLQDLFWPDETMEAGRNALRVALHSLRKQLEPSGTPYNGVLFADRSTVHLNPAACITDVAQFVQMLRTAPNHDPVDRLTRALTWYKGELLPGFYDDWVIGERERLGEIFVRTALHLSRLLLDAGQYEQALDPTRRAAFADPFSEEACRLLMQAHARLGNPETARQQYHRLAGLLRERNAAPSPQTRSLAAQLEQIAEAAAKAPDRLESPPVVAPPAPLPPALPPLVPPPPAATPPASPQQSSTIPFAFTRFFGRETEKAALCSLLTSEAEEAAAQIRQITLTGAGGSGKTRLAMETARTLSADDAIGTTVTFVSLTEETEARRIMEAIAQSLGLPRMVSGEYNEAVVKALSSAQTAPLLVLDGFEQLVAGGSSIVLFLLKSVPRLRILLTSRRRLEIPGEHEFPVAPLPVPTRDGLSLEKISRVPAVQLFLNRAQAAQNDFVCTPRNAADLIAVVIALEGIPLALELAAARIRTIGIAQMRVHLTPSVAGEASPNRFSLLTARRASDTTDRHQSLWAAMAWSFHLLPPPLRTFFTHLSVFQGGWTSEAAQAVCDEPFAPEYLTQLRAHSLVVDESASTTAAAEPRFRLLDSLREFGAEQVSEDEHQTLAARHSAYFLQMADESQKGLQGDSQKNWLQKLDADYDNFRTVLRRGGTTGLELAGRLRQYWLVHGPLRESAETVAALLDQTDVLGGETTHTPSRAAALNTLGALYLRLGQYDLSEARLAQSLVLYRALHDEAGIARVLSNQGVLLMRQGNLPASQAVQKESLAIRLRIGDKWGQAASYTNLGAVTHDMGDHQASNEAHENSLRVSREIGDTRGMGTALLNLATLAASAQNTERARTLYEECLAIAKAQNNVGSMGIAHLNLGGLLSNHPDTWNEAEAHFSEAFRLYQKAGEQSLAGSSLLELGRIATAQKNLPLAQSRLVEALAYPLTRVIMCTALESFGDLRLEQNEAERAATLFGAVDAVRRESRIPRQTPAHEAVIAERLNELRQRLGEKTFAACWSRGQNLSLEQACDFAKQPPPAANKKTKKPLV